MNRRLRALVAGGIAGAALLALPVAAQASLTLKPCAKVHRERCGHLVVPLDRTGALPGTVSLNVHVVPARVSKPTGTILLLAGGPGQAATPFADVVSGLLGAVADANRVVVFDQRGTGNSGNLRCPALRVLALNAAATARCAQQLGPRRAAYSTAASVEDIDAVRAALGVDKLTIIGVSYGTKVALDYASAHADHVDKLVLDSTLDPANPDPFALSTFTAIPRVMRTICAKACPFTKDAGAELDALATRLRLGALRGPWIDNSGRRRISHITGAQLLQLIGATDLDPLLSAMLPGAVHDAAKGDATPLISLYKSGAGAEQLAGQDSNAILVATNCEDMGTVWPIGTPVDQRAGFIATALAALPPTAFGAFGAQAGADDSVPDICRTWPESPIAQPPPASPAVPTLILSGGLDLRTPSEVADGLAARLPDAQVVHVSGVGHSVLTTDPDGCVAANTAAFLAGRTVSDCTTSKSPIGVLPPAPSGLADVAPAQGLHGTVGRLATAATLTAADLIEQTIFASSRPRHGTITIPALRAGYARLSYKRGTIALRHYSYVPGVELSGDAAHMLRLRGPGGVRGRIFINDRGTRVTGTIAGHAISARIDDPLLRVLSSSFGAGAVPSASAILARWPTLPASTTSSSSAPPASLGR